MKKNVNLNLEANIYQEIRRSIPTGQVSNFVNNLLKEHLKKIEKEKLIAGYKSVAKSKIVREEDKIWEGSIEDGIDE